LGGSLETGNVYNSFRKIKPNTFIFSGSIFYGAKTPLGPIYLSYGKSEGNNDAVYLFFGQPFR
jgi:NTE family protein